MSSKNSSDERFKGVPNTWNYRVVKKRGYLAVHTIPKAIYSSAKIDQYEAVIEAGDSSFWRVYARDHSIIHRIASKFHDVRVTQINCAD